MTYLGKVFLDTDFSLTNNMYVRHKVGRLVWMMLHQGLLCSGTHVIRNKRKRGLDYLLSTIVKLFFHFLSSYHWHFWRCCCTAVQRNDVTDCRSWRKRSVLSNSLHEWLLQGPPARPACRAQLHGPPAEPACRGPCSCIHHLGLAIYLMNTSAMLPRGRVSEWMWLLCRCFLRHASGFGCGFLGLSMMSA